MPGSEKSRVRGGKEGKKERGEKKNREKAELGLTGQGG